MVAQVIRLVPITSLFVALVIASCAPLARRPFELALAALESETKRFVV